MPKGSNILVISEVPSKKINSTYCFGSFMDLVFEELRLSYARGNVLFLLPFDKCNIRIEREYALV